MNKIKFLVLALVLVSSFCEADDSLTTKKQQLLFIGIISDDAVLDNIKSNENK